MTAESLVSVIIPTHFRNDQLRLAIRSAQDQTHTPIEIIVVDDSGEQHAESVCTEFDITYLTHEENKGANPARNTGIEVASGEYIQLLDDDDELAERKIEKQLMVFESASDVGVVYCGLENTKGENIYPTPAHRGDVYHAALRIFALHPCLTGTMLIDSDVLQTIYPLKARDAADDIGMKIRLANETNFDYVDKILYHKGDSENHRSQSDAFPREVVNILRENAAAIDAAPDSVSDDAKQGLLRHRALQHLHKSLWSWDAIRLYWRAIRLSDEFDSILVASFVSSWFGQPGYRVASTLNHILSFER